MPQAQSNTTRQLSASLACVETLRCQPHFDSPEAIAERLTFIRETQIARLTQIVADESEHLPNSITWRDVFCHECDGIECTEGTARQLATKLFDLGWEVPTSRPNLECPKCAEVD